MHAILWGGVAVLLVGLLIGLPAIIYFFPALRPLLRQYQTLAGSLITLVAAGVALFGVWVAVDGQRQITERQLAAQRQAEERQRLLKREQVAGAFIGEISMILTTLSDERLHNRIERALTQLRAAKGVTTTMDIMFRRPGKQLDAFYRANTIEAGQFQTPLPELLTRFYGLYAVFEDTGALLVREVDTGFKDANASILEETLQNQLSVLDQLREVGRNLITNLEIVRNAPVP